MPESRSRIPLPSLFRIHRCSRACGLLAMSKFNLIEVGERDTRRKLMLVDRSFGHVPPSFSGSGSTLFGRLMCCPYATR
jgi:hypothetical protein